MKSLIDFVCERQIINFNSANPNYNQCVILAGGAASGKGFIQHKIDITGKVFDVDELKKKYQKLVKAGIFKDDYEYDLTNPEDTAKLHQKIKQLGWKNKERDNFWKSKDSNNGDKRHSSGLMPNIIFDMVSKDINDIEEIVTQAKANGYTVTLVWVVCNKETAKVSNIIRGIGERGKTRSVPDSVLLEGHKDAYNTITNLLNNKYDYINEFIDVAWIGFSCGYGRHLEAKYKNNPVIKIKKDKNDKFIFNQSEVDEFLKEQQPIDYNSLKYLSEHPKNDYTLKKIEKFKELALDFDEKKFEEAKGKITESFNNYAELIVSERANINDVCETLQNIRELIGDEKIIEQITNFFNVDQCDEFCKSLIDYYDLVL